MRTVKITYTRSNSKIIKIDLLRTEEGQPGNGNN